MAERTCSIEDCDRRHFGHGYCQRHYRRWREHGDPNVTLRPARGEVSVRPPAERFSAKVRISETGCWEWTGARQVLGYGTFVIDGRTVLVHRWSYEHFVGPIPAGLVIDHLCRNRACCNPEHLEPVTNGENVLRGVGHSAQNARKQRCQNDHPLTGDNVFIEDGRRVCRTCRNEWKRARRAARKGTS